MEEFSKTHPDFPLKGTFFINYTSFFQGKGTPQERLKYLISEGFEIGNHTVNHANLKKITTAQGVESEIGGHAKKTQALIPGYTVDELALPLGITSKKFKNYIEKGEFEGTKYQNKVVLLVGANPALSPIDKKLDLLNLPRVRAMGYKPVELDMYYWLNYFDKNPREKYISDGNKDAFTVPAKYKERINEKNSKKIILIK
jgi:peptidoglycan/xylan/chitin deacetylase (PgdA/CDA1 family)